VSVQPIPLESRKAEFDLLLDLFEDGEIVWGRLEYSADIFDPATVEHIVAAFQRLLWSVADHPVSASRAAVPGRGRALVDRVPEPPGPACEPAGAADRRRGDRIGALRLAQVHEAAVLARHGTRLVGYLTGEQVPGAGDLTAYLAGGCPTIWCPRISSCCLPSPERRKHP